MSFDYPEPNDVLWAVLYRDAWGEPKYVDFLFFRRSDAEEFAIRNQLRNPCIVTSDEFYAFRDTFVNGYNSEVAYLRSTIPRPVSRKTYEVEMVDEPEFRDITPRVGYTNIVPRKQSLFQPAFAGRPKRRSQPIEDEDDDIIVTTTDGR
jgi:hypothetical protein